MSIPSRPFLPLPADLVARLPPDLVASLGIPPDVAKWLAGALGSIQQAGSYIPAGTQMLPAAEPFPSSAAELDAAFADLGR